MTATINHGPGETIKHTGPFAFWLNRPLFVRIAIGLALGLVVGLILHQFWHGADTRPIIIKSTNGMAETSRLVMRALGAIAPPLIMLAVIRSLVATEIKGKEAGKLVYLLLLNTFAAIFIGLFVANTLRPGQHVAPVHDTAIDAKKPTIDPLTDFLNSVPDSLVRPLVENNSIGVIILAISFGMAARKLPTATRDSTLSAVSALFDLVVIVLHWVLELVPLAVFCRVASLLATGGLDPFKSLAWFVFAVLVRCFCRQGTICCASGCVRGSALCDC